VVRPANFDNDPFDDLAVGVPGEDIGAVVDAGTVVTVYGGDSQAPGTFRQGAGGVAGAAERGDRFGAALAIGRFNDDPYSDVAVGVPGEDVGTAADAGAVNLVEGTDAGLRPGALYLQGHPERGDRFGSSLTLNYFLADLGADLAVGAPGETVNGVAGAGAVSLFDGNATAPGREWLLYVDLGPDATAPARPGDAFGASVGWYTANSPSPGKTLVAGAPGRDRFGTDAGAVYACFSVPGQGVLVSQAQLQSGRPRPRPATASGPR